MYKKNRIKEMIDNGQIPLGTQRVTEDPALRSWYQVYVARTEELGLRPAHQTADIFGRQKWPEPLNLFEVKTVQQTQTQQSNSERN